MHGYYSFYITNIDIIFIILTLMQITYNNNKTEKCFSVLDHVWQSLDILLEVAS